MNARPDQVTDARLTGERTLSADELYEVTGARKRDLQREVLRRARIYFWERHDGTIGTTWHHVNHPMTGSGSRPHYGGARGV